MRDLLEMLLGPEGRRRLRLRHMTNDELFRQYDAELMLRLHNAKDLGDTRRLLEKFKAFIGPFPPTVELAKGFLSRYLDRKPRTMSRYSKMIGGLMKWYGEPLDLKIKIPKSLPEYVENGDIEKLIAAIENKKSHKGCIVRDLLIVDLALTSGMRRSELANLKTEDIHADFLFVRSGKGQKDRIIPLLPGIASRLHNFTREMAPDDKVFRLTAPSIANKIRQFSKKAGVSIHTHSLRHKFATDLLEKGADIKQVQTLLGHINLNTTEVYLGIKDSALRDAINLLTPVRPPQESMVKVDKASDSSYVQKTDPAASSSPAIPPSGPPTNKGDNARSDVCISPPDGISLPWLRSQKVPDQMAPDIIRRWRSAHEEGEHEVCHASFQLVEDLKGGVPPGRAEAMFRHGIHAARSHSEKALGILELYRLYEAWKGGTYYRIFMAEVRRRFKFGSNS